MITVIIIITIIMICSSSSSRIVIAKVRAPEEPGLDLEDLLLHIWPKSSIQNIYIYIYTYICVYNL